MTRLQKAAKKYLAIEHEKTMKDFEARTLGKRLYHWSVSTDESNFWLTFHNEMVRAFTREFGPKYTPELSTETDRMPIGLDDLDALITAVRHIQSYLEQHDKDHDSWDRIHGCTR